MTGRLQSISNPLFFAGVLLFAIGLPLSMFLMSVSQLIIIVAWLFNGDLKEKLKKAFSNKVVLLLTAFFFWHVAGLLYTTDLQYGFKDVRVKLPLLLVPIVFSSMPVFSDKQFKTLALVFVASVLVSTLISMCIYVGIIPIEFHNVRDISVFISHIRLSLLICIAVYISFWLFRRVKYGYGLLLVIIWFLYFLTIIESVTGLGILAVVVLIYAIKKILNSKSVRLKGIIASSVVTAVTILAFNIKNTWHEVTFFNEAELNSLAVLTAKGMPYMHDTLSREAENGHPVWINICEPELREAWNHRSKINYDGKNLNGDEIKRTIFRFLSSKGLKKDAHAVQLLTEAEIEAIEHGVANADELIESNIHNRLRVTLWELNNYRSGGNASGHSLTMRFEFWQTALQIIKQHALTGVGTGDVPDAFAKKYDEANSMLETKFRLRSHNQFLAVAVALGIPALLLFIIVLFYPVFQYQNSGSFLYMTFWVTAFLSMLTEDTLETQAGVSFFIFFNSLFLFLKNKELDKNFI